MPKTNAEILIVEDSETHRVLLTTLLSQNGYETYAVSSGDEALNRLEGGKIPELILLDVVMPGIDGFQVMETISSHDEWRKIPVIFLTVRTSTSEIVKGFRMGCVDYIGKPFSGDELLARVNTHLALKHSREENRRLKEYLSICAFCERIQDESGDWVDWQMYITDHSTTKFSHGLCPICMKREYPDTYRRVLEAPDS